MNSESAIVNEVRERAMAISDRFGHDLHQYAEYLRRMQADPRNRDRVVSQVTVVPARADTPRRSLG